MQGLYEDFGYWEQKIDGSYLYTSLVKENDLTVFNDEEFWNVLYYDNWLIFQSLSRLVMFNEESKELKTFLPSENIFNSFIVDKRVYYTSSSGLFTIENGIELLVSNGSKVEKY
jgi:hypothetical protein